MSALCCELLIDGLRLLTLAPDSGFEPIEEGALAFGDGRILYAGPARDLPSALWRQAESREYGDGLLATPAFVDCHTHLVFAGDRSEEFFARLAGTSYAEIAARGGGILATVRATRKASEEALFASALARAEALIASGVATLEVKSGYALDLEGEAKMLSVARRLGKHLGITVRTSLLAAHALPPEYAGRREDYLRLIAERMIPEFAAAGLIDAVDAYLEPFAFSADEVAQLFAAARACGLPVKLHADQLSNGGGAALAARFGALSADHLEYTDQAGVEALARAGTVAVLLPGAFFALREDQRPPVAALRAAGVPIALATDANPGTSPLTSLTQAMNLGCVLFGLCLEEALYAVTVHAARALGLADRGRLLPGMRADVALWRAERPAELAYWLGGMRAERVYAAGRAVGARTQPFACFGLRGRDLP